jgi:DNA-directed RNA polymerase specialized sigma24 family protein
MTTPADRNDYVPESYEDLYRYYIVGDGRGNSLCQQLVRSMMRHATPEELETLPHDVFARILEKDLLRTFDPTKANFGGVIYFVTRTIVVNYLGRKGRDPVGGLNGGSIVESDPEEGEFEPGTYSLERLFGATEKGTLDRRDDQRLVIRLIEWAESLAAKPANVRDSKMLELLELLSDECSPKECSEALGVTPSTIHNWLQVLRFKVAELQGG